VEGPLWVGNGRGSGPDYSRLQAYVGCLVQANGIWKRIAGWSAHTDALGERTARRRGDINWSAASLDLEDQRPEIING
jgi:hypothetical protein